MPQVQAPEATLPLLIAPFRDILIALPMGHIQKVLRSPQIFRSSASNSDQEQNFLGIIHFEGQEAIAIDLHQRVYRQPNPEPENFVAILQTAQGRYYGIPLTTLPVMVTVATSQLRSLPAEFRDRDALGIASHVAQIQSGGKTKTIFLLDLDQIFN